MRNAAVGDEPPSHNSSAAGDPAAQYKIVIECDTEMQQTELPDEFGQRKLMCKALVG